MIHDEDQVLSRVHHQFIHVHPESSMWEGLFRMAHLSPKYRPHLPCAKHERSHYMVPRTLEKVTVPHLYCINSLILVIIVLIVVIAIAIVSHES